MSTMTELHRPIEQAPAEPWPRSFRRLAFLVPGYFLLLAGLGPIGGPSRVALSLGIVLAGLVPSAVDLLTGSWTARDLGWTTGVRPARACLDAVLAALPFLALLLLAKWWLTRPGGALAGEPLLVTPPAWFALVYTVSVLLQESAARGYLQTDLARAWRGRSGEGSAVVVASAVFGLLHLHQSAAVALLSFAGGLVWGELHRKHRSLLAPVLSHALVGHAVIALDGWRIMTGSAL